MKREIVVIGAGVAGMTSAIYLKRAGVDPLIIEMSRPGGQINFAPLVENFPGYLSITGRDFSKKVYEQMEFLNVEYLKDEVLSVNKNDGYFSIKLKNNEIIDTKNIIIATGKKIKRLNIPNVNSFLGVGLSYCATCDGKFFEGKDVLVVGDTNKALEESMYLANLCSKVYILCENNFVKADTFYRDKIASLNNVEILYNSKLQELIKDDVLERAIIIKDNEEISLNVSGCFAYVGYLPNSEVFSSLVELNGDNYIIVDKNKETSCKGVYAVGDVTDTKVYQLVTACSDAAVAVDSYLSSK